MCMAFVPPGQYPWEMHDAANALEAIANNAYDHPPFADVSWSYPKISKFQPHLTVWCPSNTQNLVSYFQGLTPSWSSSWTWRAWWTTPSGTKSGSSAAPSSLTRQRCFPRISIPTPTFQSASRHQISCGWFVKDLMVRMQSGMAATLWGKGVPMAKAIELVEEAVMSIPA